MGKREMGRSRWNCSSWRGEREVPGCMSGMLQFFDFHHFPLATKNGSSRAGSAHNSLPQLHHCHSQLKGVEAPRNSLELDEEAAAKASSNASALAEEYYGIPFGIQIKSTPSLTKRKEKKKDSQLLAGEEEEEENSSQCETPRTPNVIARLMGLEILPDDALITPSLTPKKNRMNKKTSNRKPLQKIDTNLMGSRSLPDTPRASSERTWDSNPRLSLQINKESNNNNNNNRAMHLCDVSHLLPPLPRRRDCYNTIQDENNKSPRSHRREIVKHLKENIDYRRGTSNVADGNAVTRSSRTRKTDKKRLLVENSDLVEFPKPQSPPKAPRPRSTVRFKVGENIGEKQDNRKKANWERYTERIKRQPPASEIATQSHVMLPNPLSSACSNLIALPQNSNEKIKSRDNVSATSTRRREATSRSPLPPLERTCAALLINPTQKQQPAQYKRARTDEDPEFLYVRTILERAGIMTNPTRELRWYSPSLPIDPSIYHELELDLPLALGGPLQHRCNRKLLFYLIEEVLGDVSRSSSTSTQKRWFPKINKELLPERLWSQIKSFPLANCQIIEDIDALVAGDMAEAKVRHLLRHPLVVAEADDIVSEIEEDVVDSIIDEATASLTRKCTCVR